MIDNKIPDEPIDSLRDISEKWNSDLYEGLKLLERFEKIAKLGDDDLMSWIKTIAMFPTKFPIIYGMARVESIEYFLEEFKILLVSYKKLISVEEHKLIEAQLTRGFEILQRRNLFRIYQSDKGQTLELLPDFSDGVKLISELRDLFINCEGINKRLFIQDADTKDKKER